MARRVARWAWIVAVAVVLGVLLGGSWADPGSSEAAARRVSRAKITWKPGSLSVTMAPGETRTLSTTFTASAPMPTTAMVKSARSPLTMDVVGPAGPIEVGKSYAVTVTLTLDPAARVMKAGGSAWVRDVTVSGNRPGTLLAMVSVAAAPSPTRTPTAAGTSANTPTPTNSPAATNTPLPISTPTSTPTRTPTNTPVDTATPTSTSTPTDTPTNTPTSTLTSTPTATPTNTPTSTPTTTATSTPTSTSTQTPTNTATNTRTSTPASSPTNTPTSTPTNTPTATATFTATATATPTATPATLWFTTQSSNQFASPGPAGAVDAAFNDTTGSKTARWAQSTANHWTFSGVQTTSFIAVTGASLELPWRLGSVVDDVIALEVHDGSSWTRATTFPTGTAAPTTLTTQTYDLSAILGTPAEVNAAQVRLVLRQSFVDG